MKAEVTATSVSMRIEMTQRELDLFHQLMSKISGFEAERLSELAGTASEYTEIVIGLSQAARPQAREVVTLGADNRVNPSVKTR